MTDILGTLKPPAWHERTAKPKPGRGASDLQRKTDAKAERLLEEREKAKARKRDAAVGGCRWPKKHCPYCSEGLKVRREVAHLVNKSQLGENHVTNLIQFCYLLHQGVDSIHSKDRRVVPLDKKKGANGPCRFEHRVNGVWVIEGVERSVGVFV